MNKVYMLGMGAIGASCASKFYDAGIEVKIICDEARKKKYIENGFIINNKRYDFDYVTPEDHEPAEFIMICVKYHHLKDTIDLMENFVTEKTTIMSLLNGIDSEEIIGEKYGMDKMVYAYIVQIDAIREGNRIDHSDSGRIVFGEKSNERSERIEAIAALYEKCRIGYEIPDDILKSMWWKFMINVGTNQTTAILNSTYNAFKNCEHARWVMNETMREVIRLSQAMGINLDEEDLTKWYETFEKMMDEGKTSMLQDVQAKRKTEVEMFAGRMCELGKQYGVATPINEMFYHMLKTIEWNNGFK